MPGGGPQSAGDGEDEAGGLPACLHVQDFIFCTFIIFLYDLGNLRGRNDYPFSFTPDLAGGFNIFVETP